jgi:hypothetical protein
MNASRRVIRPTRGASLALVAALGIMLTAGSASAQSGDAGELDLRGLLSVRFAHAYEMSDLDVGGKLGDSQGVDVAAGLRMGEHFAFQLGWEWQTDDDFDTHYFPAQIRGYSPALLERIRLYGDLGIGILFTRMHNDFNANDDERAAAFHAGGGLQIDVTEEIGLLWYVKYKRGLGELDDFESVVHGVGLQYSWGL